MSLEDQLLQEAAQYANQLDADHRADLEAAFVAGYRASMKRGRTHIPLDPFEERAVRKLFDRHYEMHIE